MPAFVAGFTAFFTGATVVGVAGTLGYLTAIVTFNAALGAIARKLTSRKESDAGQRQPREITVRSADAYDVFVYGRALVGGVTVYHNGIPDTTGLNNRMHHVVKWAGHECTSISLFKLDDRRLNPGFNDVDWDPVAYTGTGLVETGEFRGATTTSGPTYMRWYLGDQTSSDQRLTQQADEWTTAHIGHKQTYGVLEIWQVDEEDQTSKVYQKGFPQNIAGLIHGKKVYDHRRYALNRDPSFTDTQSWWSGFLSNSFNFVPGSLREWSTTEGIGGPNDRGVVLTDNDADGDALYCEPIPVNPSSRYTVFATMRRMVGDRPARVSASYYDTAGSLLSTDVLFDNQLPSVWSSYFFQIGSGGSAIPASAHVVRVGPDRIGSSALFAANTTQIQVQDCGVYLGTGSRHLANVSSTWAYSESPPFCVADYLRDERLGFGKRLRVPVNPSRYARNGDPTWRRQSTLNVATWWRTRPESSNTTPLGSTASISLTQTGAPVGRRALVMVGSSGTTADGHFVFSEAIPIDPTGQYIVSVHARQDGAKAARLAVSFLDGNGNNIPTNSSNAAGWPSGAFHYFHNNEPLTEAWSNYVIDIGSGAAGSIPSCASFLSIGALCVRSFGANGETQQYFQEFQVHVGTQIRHFIEPHEQIFWPSVSSAAAYTDAIVATPSGDQVRFACNGAGHTGRGHRENVRDLLSSFNGHCIYVQSGFWINAGWDEPTKTLGKSDFREGGMKIRAKAELSDRYNHVRGTFFDPAQDYKNVPTATVKADEYIARDSSQQLFHDTHLPFTNDWFMAQRVEFGILEQGDNQQLVEFQLKHSALDLMPGRVVGINHDVVSWANHTLRMVDMKTDLKKGVTLFAKEDYEASYVDPSTSEYFSRTVTEVTSAAPIVPQVSSVSVTPRDGGIQLNWNNPAARSFEWIDVYRRTTNAFSGSTLIKSTRNDEYFDTLQAGQTQFYWFRSRDFAGNVSSIYPGLVSSFSGAGLFPVARDPQYIFFDEFRYQSLSEFHQKWEHNTGSGAVTFVNTGDFGGKVLQSSGYTWWVSRTRIPFDPDALYQMRAKVRQTNSVDANRLFYAGFTGYKSDGTTAINVASQASFASQHYFVRSAQSLNSLDLWFEYTGHLRGHMPWPLSGTVNANISEDPKLAARMHSLTRYVSPLFILNHDTGGGTAQLDYIEVRKLTPFRTVTFDPEITAQSNWIAAPSIAGLGTSSSSVQSITNVNVDGEYSVLALNDAVVANGTNYFIAERFRPDFHPRMPSSGAYASIVMARVTSNSAVDQVTFRPTVIAYTRTGSAVAFFTGLGALTIGSDASLGPGGDFNQWHEASGTINVGSNASVNPNSGPYFLAPGCRVVISPTFANSQGVLSSGWIAYLNITAGNP